MALIVNRQVEGNIVRYKGKLYKRTNLGIASSSPVYICPDDRYSSVDEIIYNSNLKQDSVKTLRPVFASVNKRGLNESIGQVNQNYNTFEVKVINKNNSNPFFNQGSNKCISLSGYQNLELNLISGKTYYFKQTDSSNINNKLKITTDAAGNNSANISNYSYTGTSGVNGVLFFAITDETPSTYYMSSEGGTFMGIKINLNRFYESLPSSVANYSILSGDSYYTQLPPTIPCNPNDNVLFDLTTFGEIDQAVRNATIQGANRWANFIKINPNVVAGIKNNIDSTWGGIKLNSFTTINDPNNYIAACGIHTFVDIQPGGTGLQFCPLSFNLSSNSHYLNIYTEQDWARIMAHELGHALGIGIFWNSNLQQYGAVPPINYFLNGNSYTSTKAAYNNITALSRNKIPLENTGGSGTQSAHWENSFRPSTDPGTEGVSYPGLSNELMVGFYSPSTNFVISDLSIKALVDFGYIEKNPGTNEGSPTLVNS